jgi:D-glycero-alpha-D-manno-heptose 1-phosphate guanylyltransferase
MTRRAVILAGGLGTRIKHVLPDLPKPLAPVYGRPFLEWVIRYLRRQGFDEIVVSSGYMAEKIAQAGLGVECVAEPAPLGTAGGFLHAIKGKPKGPWLVCNGDSLALADLTPLLSGGSAILGLKVPDASRYGSLDVENGRLKAFAEKRPGAGLINAGVYYFDEIRFSEGRSFETEVFPALLAKGEEIRVAEASCPFLDIGTEASLGLADLFVSEHSRYF